MSLVDVHCHLDSNRYTEEEVDEMVKVGEKDNLIFITNGTGMSSSQKGLLIGHKYKQVYVCVGLGYDRKYKLDEVSTRLCKMARDPKVVGIGECGLNYYQGIDEETKNYQKLLFSKHIETANKLGLPIEIHNRNADVDILDMLNEFKGKVVMHCFTRNEDFMKQCVDRGWYISFGGLMTYTHNKKMQRVATLVPNNLLLTETDAPYSTPKGKTGKNSPVNVKIVAEALANCRSISTNLLEQLTTENAGKVFFNNYS